MKITIQNARTLDNKSLVLIWLGNKQVVMSKDEFNLLKENIKLFETGEKETAQEVPVQEQSSQMVKPLNGCKWIGELAEQVAIRLTTRDTLSKH